MVIYQVGNIFIKQMFFEFSKDHRIVLTHSHEYDHVTLLAYGSVKVLVDGVEKTYRAPACIDIKAGTHHQITALEDHTVAYCIHDTRGLEEKDLGIPLEGIQYVP